jgi:hypothetical protein
MFKTIIPAAIAAIALLIPTSALAGQEHARAGWTEIIEDDEARFFLRDQDWKNGRSHMTNVKVWARIQMIHPDPIWTSAMVYYRINCVNDTFQTIQATYYNADGSVKSTAGSNAPTHPVPGSNAGEMVRLTCVDPQPRQSAPAFEPTPSWET